MLEPPHRLVRCAEGACSSDCSQCTKLEFLPIPHSALTLCGDALADLVKENHVSNGIRWMSCGSYGVGMLGIWALAILEREEDKPGELWLPKVRWQGLQGARSYTILTG